MQGKNEEARRIYEKILELHNQLCNSSDLQQEIPLQTMLWCEIGWTWYSSGNNGQALRCYERAEHILTENGILGGSAWAYIRFGQSYAYWREGNYTDAYPIAQETLKLFEGAVDKQKDGKGYTSRATRIRRTLAGDPVDLGRTHRILGMIEASEGRSREALSHYNMSLALFEQYDYLREIAIVCCDLGDFHLGKAEYSQAQAALRRSLGIAERIGELPLLSFGFANLGLLDLRCGNLIEAEVEHRHSISLTERVGDEISMGILYTGLSTVLIEQGKLVETRSSLYRALSIGRDKHIAPCIAFALVALGNLRIIQAIELNLSDSNTSYSSNDRERGLYRAKRALQRALSLEGMEAETRTDGQLLLAQAMLLLGEIEEALQLATQTLAEAQQYELTWLIARAQRLLGTILCAQGQYEEASQYFEQARRTFQKCGMRLEHGRTLYQYGLMLVQQDEDGGKLYQRGVEYLREAHQLFLACGAALDVRMAERELGRCAVMSRG